MARSRRSRAPVVLVPHIEHSRESKSPTHCWDNSPRRIPPRSLFQNALVGLATAQSCSMQSLGTRRVEGFSGRRISFRCCCLALMEPHSIWCIAAMYITWREDERAEDDTLSRIDSFSLSVGKFAGKRLHIVWSRTHSASRMFVCLVHLLRLLL
jgi:hypothetical protein